nr:MAG TPA: hypothetical protein [Caudoviricetes sp.]
MNGGEGVLLRIFKNLRELKRTKKNFQEYSNS